MFEITTIEKINQEIRNGLMAAIDPTLDKGEIARDIAAALIVGKIKHVKVIF